MTARAAALTLVLALGACKPAVDVERPSPFEEDDPAALPDEPMAAEGEPAPRAAEPVPPRGQRRLTVARATLHAALDRGPGHFLRGVELKPHLRGNRFEGWEIVQFMPGEARFDDIDMRAGDVVGPINGRHVPRPEHLAELWSELRTAETIVIEVRRSGERFELRFEIVDAESAPMP